MTWTERFTPVRPFFHNFLLCTYMEPWNSSIWMHVNDFKCSKLQAHTRFQRYDWLLLEHADCLKRLLLLAPAGKTSKGVWGWPKVKLLSHKFLITRNVVCVGFCEWFVCTWRSEGGLFRRHFHSETRSELVMPSRKAGVIKSRFPPLPHSLLHEGELFVVSWLIYGFPKTKKTISHWPFPPFLYNFYLSGRKNISFTLWHAAVDL